MRCSKTNFHSGMKNVVRVICLGGAAAFIASCATVSKPAARGAGYQPAMNEVPLTTLDNVGDFTLEKSRPGLGTEMGRTLSSRITGTWFDRASSKPAGVSSIYYNDKEGIEATAGQWKYDGKGMQKAANGMVEWGVRSTWVNLPNYHSKGKRFVMGRKGQSYQLVVKNLCHSRLEVVFSVDGLDVMDGQAASVKKRGYIVQPDETLVVKGFRTSEAAVASFKFSTVSDSYTKQMHGKTRNVGVIGMAVFTEKGRNPWKWARPVVKERMSAKPFND